MTLIEAALLDQMRRVLAMDPASFPKHDSGPPTAWCVICHQGIGRTKPNKTGYCTRSGCRKAWRAAELAQKKAA